MSSTHEFHARIPLILGFQGYSHLHPRNFKVSFLLEELHFGLNFFYEYIIQMFFI
jgi:hypothetical protein